ncbi:MAG TPA: hypothetical protein GXZ86_04320 [Clostridiales bacterium]|jgi:hypothetical protein|nr:hypothetical protein [Clostridiales bacterium]
MENLLRRYEIGAYHQNESELTRSMEKYGFRNVTTEYITINLTPDNPCCSKDMAHAMINANRLCSLDSVERLLHVADNLVTFSEVEKLKQVINTKYDKRIKLYDQGIKQRGTNVSVTMVVRGMKWFCRQTEKRSEKSVC